jgi:hypothetical protein
MPLFTRVLATLYLSTTVFALYGGSRGARWRDQKFNEMKKFVMAPTTSSDRITPLKTYEVQWENNWGKFRIKDDQGNPLYCFYTGCPNTGKKDWVVVNRPQEFLLRHKFLMGTVIVGAILCAIFC